MVGPYGSNRWLYIWTATPLALLLFITLTNPSIHGQAKDYVVSHLPLIAPTSIAVSVASKLHNSPGEASKTERTGLNHGWSPPKASYTATRVLSTLLTISTPTAVRTGNAATLTTGISDSVARETEKPVYDTLKWFYQFDVDSYPLPDFSISIDELRKYPPHNYKGPGHEAYATFFATRNGTLRDPYFLSALQIVYRLLWDEKIRGIKPVVVFVPPFVPDEQRQFFQAAGAMVREVDIREFTPDEQGVIPERLKDMFTKLEMWRHTDFDRIMYLDSDAVPFRNLDDIWDLARQQKCRLNRLPEEDMTYGSTICDYVFAAWPETAHGMLNAGVMVLKPTMPMYTRLVRELLKPHGRNEWDDSIMEQAFLDHMFNYASPFPSTNLSFEWNAVIDKKDAEMDPRIMHGKIWSITFNGTAAPEEVKWIIDEYDQTWERLRKFYESEEFFRMRKEDLQAVVEGPLYKSPKVVEQSKAQDTDQIQPLEELVKDDTQKGDAL